PTRSDEAPGNIVGPLANQANIFSADNRYSVTQSSVFSSSQNYLTNGGAYSSSPSFYGTFDQGGNLLEMTDTVYETGPNLVFRGASWSDPRIGTRSSSRNNAGPAFESAITGFRVASP
ncbi:MAG: SUMF1/EgtB/PvdO family nonheme iron enzyme, partial [Verrucomicrobiota bacterium]